MGKVGKCCYLQGRVQGSEIAAQYQKPNSILVRSSFSVYITCNRICAMILWITCLFYFFITSSYGTDEDRLELMTPLSSTTLDTSDRLTVRWRFFFFFFFACQRLSSFKLVGYRIPLLSYLTLQRINPQRALIPRVMHARIPAYQSSLCGRNFL